MSKDQTSADSGEVQIRTETGVTIVVPAFPADCQYVRLLDGEQQEIAFWDAEEWRRDPQMVMGAIFGAVCAGAEPRETMKRREDYPIATRGKVIMHGYRDPASDEPLFWSNTDGWVSLESATVFGDEEDIDLPREAWGVVHLPED